MPVREKTATSDEVAQEQQAVQDKQKAVGDKLVEGLDLPFGPEPSEEQGEEVKLKEKPITPDEVEDEPKKDEEPEEQAKSEEETEEDVVPYTKFKKRVDALTAEKKILEAQVQELKESKTPQGDRKQKLEQMTEAELKTLKHQAMGEWKAEGDPAREKQLVELMDEIDEIARTAGTRFQTAQVEAYNNAVREVYGDPANESIDFEDEKVSAEIKQLAQQVYQKHPELQRLKAGQATALKLAVDHYREISRFSKGKSEKDNLKRQVNNLKRKTSLDSSSVKGNINRSDLKKKYERAKKTNTFHDKEQYLDGIVDVDRYLSPEHKK